MAKKNKRPGYLRVTWRDERGRDRTCEITAILASELVQYGIAELKARSTKEMRLRPEYLLVKADGKWRPETRVEALPKHVTHPLDWRFKVRTNAEVMIKRALYNIGPDDAIDFRWILALNAG